MSVIALPPTFVVQCDTRSHPVRSQLFSALTRKQALDIAHREGWRIGYTGVVRTSVVLCPECAGTRTVQQSEATSGNNQS